jgi:hypothetical protein
MDAIVRAVDQYDIVFLQEIRDNDGSAFVKLCARLPDYECINSSRAGNTSYKEQIGLLYRKGLNLTLFKDFNPDPQNRWHRPPVMAEFGFGGKLMPSFWWDSTKPRFSAWLLKKYGLPWLYWHCMLKGREWLARCKS